MYFPKFWQRGEREGFVCWGSRTKAARKLVSARRSERGSLRSAFTQEKHSGADLELSFAGKIPYLMKGHNVFRDPE